MQTIGSWLDILEKIKLVWPGRQKTDKDVREGESCRNVSHLEKDRYIDIDR